MKYPCPFSTIQYHDPGGKGVFVFVGVDVRVKVGVLVRVGVRDGVTDQVGVLVGVFVLVAVLVKVGVFVLVAVAVNVGVLVFVGVFVLVGVLVLVGVGVLVGLNLFLKSTVQQSRHGGQFSPTFSTDTPLRQKLISTFVGVSGVHPARVSSTTHHSPGSRPVKQYSPLALVVVDLTFGPCSVLLNQIVHPATGFPSLSYLCPET